jgi:hypothetical protein
MTGKEALGGACRPPQTPRLQLGLALIIDGGSGGGGTPHPAFPLAYMP